MLDDFVLNYLKSEPKFGKDGTTYREIIQLIGQPDSFDTTIGMTKFLVEEKFEYNLDPNGYVHLELYFSKDSLLQKWVVVETEFEP